MKVSVIGGNGQLGVDICSVLSNLEHNVVSATHSDIEIGNEESVRSFFATTQPDAVINTAAMHQVEQCESDPSKAFAVNALGVRNLARMCESTGAHLIHISTDYVFDGKKGSPYVELDCPRPLNVYGVSKLAGEQFVLAASPQFSVLRVSGLYGSSPCRAKGGLNFVRLMLKLAKERPEIRVVDDEILTPTYSLDIAHQVAKVLDERLPGLVHATAQGQCSWYEFASTIFRLTGVQTKLEKARPGEFPVKVARPQYSVLDNAALRLSGTDIMPSWQDGLSRFLSTEGLKGR